MRTGRSPGCGQSPESAAKLLDPLDLRFSRRIGAGQHSQVGASAPTLLLAAACRSHRKVVSSYLANRLCLDLLVGRQRFQILDIFVSTDGDLSGPSRVFGLGGRPRCILAAACSVTQATQAAANLEARRASNG